MKKTLIAVLGMVIIAPMAWSQTNVISQNAVGYVKVTVDKGDLALLRYDFIKLDGSPASLADIVGDQVPQNSVAYYWDRIAKSWTSQVKGARGWPAGLDVARGDAFFLQPDPNAAGASFDVFMLGEVPGANNNADTTPVDNVEADAIGFPYPASTLLSGTDVGTVAAAGSAIYTWDQAGQGWNSAVTKGARGWNPDPVIAPGQGFFITSAGGALSPVESKPYTWP